MNIRLGKYRFHPGIFLTVVTALTLYALISLGFWQLSRADFKMNLQHQIEARQSLAPITLQELPTSIEDKRYLPVKLTGNFDNNHQFFLDNRIVNGRVGYDVYTPFKTEDGHVILVNRGFVGQGKSRQLLPDINVSEQLITISGILNAVPARAAFLDDNLHNYRDWPVLLQYVDLQEIMQASNYQLMDMVFYLNDGQNGALQYHLPALNLNADKNLGYAFQWFAMAFTVCLLYLYLNISKVEGTPSSITETITNE